jgi:hypothetical protein
MPQIQTYDDHISAQGGIAAQASPGDFGAQLGAATQNFGGAIQEAAQAVQQYNTTQDVTKVHVNMAKAQAEWTKTLQDRANAAQPGDDSFAPTLMKDMDAYFAKFGESVQTPQGKRLFATMSAQMSSQFGVRAIGIQGDLDSKAAVNNYTDIVTSRGSAVYQDPSQLSFNVELAKAAINDPNGQFARVPQTTRDEFARKVEQDLRYAAATKQAETNPQSVLGAISPPTLETFNLPGKVVQANTAPGGRASIGAGAMKWAPQVQAVAAAKGLNSNILLAQIEQESGGNPNAVGPMTRYGTAKGLTQFIDSTAKQYGVDVRNPQSAIAGQAAMMGDMLKRYGGDYSKALAAYNWGPGNVDKTLQVYGNEWQKHLPAETSNYVAAIMAKSGSVAGNPALADATPDTTATMADNANTAAVRAPAPAPGSVIDGLSWQQQEAILSKSVQTMHLQMSMEHRAREQADYALKKQQEAVSGQYINRIIDPDRNGGPPSDQEIADNPVLTWQEKQHMADYKLTRQRELVAAAEPKSNPTAVRSLMLQIHAADDDPTKTYSFDPVMAAYRDGSISTPEMKFLRTEVEQMKDGNGNSFQKQLQGAREKGFNTFVKSFEASLPGGSAAANDAYYRFTFDLNAKVEALRKENKDPSVLLDPKSRDYMLAPERLQTYMPSASTITAQSAAKATAAAAASAPAVTASYKDFDSLAKGDKFLDPQGNVRQK